MADSKCPKCGSQRFLVSQLTWNEQPYDAERDEWGSSDHGMEYEDYPLSAKCAECDADCTGILLKAEATTFYREPDWDPNPHDP